MSSSLRSPVPSGTLVPSDGDRHWHGKLWTQIPYKGWIIWVAVNSAVQIRHEACLGGWQWWGPLFHRTDNCGEVCQKCRTEIPVDVEDFLLKAWELYAL